MSGEALKILMIEDDDVDIMVVQRAFDKESVETDITIAKDGIEALDLLRGKNGREKIHLPELILLDLNMPRMNGYEFLDELRKDAKLSELVIFVLTTSRSDKDIFEMQKRGVAGYILKSNVDAGLVKAVSKLGTSASGAAA